MGATAFQKGLGAVHALAHPLGAIYDKHHGLLNAILLPYVVMANREAIESKLKTICAMLERPTDFDHFFSWLMDFRNQLGINNTLGEIGIGLDRSAEIGKLALEDAASGGNPIALNAQQYQGVFERAVKGEL